MKSYVKLFEEWKAKTWWHGSKDEFDAFDRPQKTTTHREQNIPTWWFTDDKDYAMKYADVPGGGWRYAARIDLRNTLDLSIPEERVKFEEWLRERPSEYSEEDIARMFDEQWGVDLPYWTNDTVLWYAAMEGYDSAYFEEELDGSVTSVAVIEDPSIIRVVDKEKV